MPEKKLWTRHVGMEALNSVGSTGSCDSIESISSNHSAFSGDGYDHLSAEERECLMFLEETIGSLDNEDDSGLSNDEVETTNKVDNALVSEPVKIPFSDGKEKLSSKTRTLPNSSEWPNAAIDLSAISQGHRSFPRVQVPKEETTKQPFDFKQDAPRKDQPKPFPEKPKRMSVINQQHIGESNLSEFLILPPPEAFRDPQIVDKRHSVTDPTDAREVRLDRILLKSAVISDNKEAPASIKQSDQKLPLPVFPRVSSPNKLTGEQEPLNQAIEKPYETQFKQGPPTAPKPRMLPPHIIIKTSKGEIPNLDPQKRPRTFSAHERSTTNDSVITTVLHAKEQERARYEALQKLGLEEKTRSQEHNSIPPSKTDQLAAPSGNEQGHIEAKRKSFINQQEKTDSSSTMPVQPQKSAINIKNDIIARNRLSMKTTLFDKANEPASGTPLANQKETHGPVSGDTIIKTKHSEKTSTQVNPDELNMPYLTDVTDYVKSGRNASQVNPVPQRKEKNMAFEPDHPDSFLNQNQDISRNSVKLQTQTAPLQASTAPEKNPALSKTSDYLKKNDHFQSIIAQQNKTGSLENINISTSPKNSSSFSPPKEPPVSQHNPKVILNDGKGRLPVDKSNRHSTHFESSDEPYLCLPQGSVPGLRQINIKSNTLERSGVGLSSSLSNLEKGGNSFFKKPIFSGNFLRNNRPRPASLGTGKDFANLEASTAVAENTEKHSFFSRPSRQSAPVTSVKIAPKGSTDEHRRQALKKLGILKE